MTNAKRRPNRGERRALCRKARAAGAVPFEASHRVLIRRLELYAGGRKSRRAAMRIRSMLVRFARSEPERALVAQGGLLQLAGDVLSRDSTPVSASHAQVIEAARRAALRTVA
jgi:hypothetical protein